MDECLLTWFPAELAIGNRLGFLRLFLIQHLAVKTYIKISGIKYSSALRLSYICVDGW